LSSFYPYSGHKSILKKGPQEGGTIQGGTRWVLAGKKIGAFKFHFTLKISQNMKTTSAMAMSITNSWIKIPLKSSPFPG